MPKTHLLPDGRKLVVDWRPAPAAPSAPAAPPVVFLNGLSQTTVAWGLQAQRLKARRSVLLHDAAGQGRSDPPPETPGGFRPAGHARDLVHLLDAHGVAQADVVGFSYGARIALRLALQDPARVRRLVLVGCAHRDTTVRRWIVRSWLDAIDTGGLEHAFRVVTPMVVGERWLARYEKDERAMLRAFVERNAPEGVRRLLSDTLLPGGALGADDLARVAHPALVVRGEEDLVVSAAISEELASLLPDARHVTCPGVGHSVAIEAPDWFTSRIEEFLA